MAGQQRRGALAAPTVEVTQIDPMVAALSQRASEQMSRIGSAIPTPQQQPEQASVADGLNWQQQPAGNAQAPTVGANGALSREYVIDGLVKRGMAPHIAAGFAMNFVDESGLNPTAVGDNGNAYGLAQLNGPRMKDLKRYAASVGQPISNPEVQMDHLMYEVNGPEAAAWNHISKARNQQEAAVAVLNYFERPAEVHRARREAAYWGSQ